MNNAEIIKELNKYNNFHLSLKVIQITDDKLLESLSTFLKDNKKSSIIITTLNNVIDELLKAYNKKIDYVLCNENIEFLLPLVTILTKEKLSLIKPLIPVLYMIKDNRIIEKIKTTCRKKMTSFEKICDEKEIFEKLKSMINLK